MRPGGRVGLRGGWALLAGAALPASARAAAPLNYLVGFGDKANPVVALTWGVLVISVIVVAIISALVIWGVLKRRTNAALPENVPVEHRGSGLNWIGWGVGISSIALVFTLIWTVVVLAEVNEPPRPAGLTIEVTGNQWWWKARYLNDDPSQVFTTANELHIPVGVPVRVKLIGADVIHSFWVPQLTGKTDTIPGQTNVTWLEASQPGRYRGQCTEYCGEQHAHMALFVNAEPPAQFEAWREAQVAPAADPTAPEAVQGEQIFAFKCGACHTVRGTDALGTVAPDLTHLMSRGTIAAGALTNTPSNLSGWIANPQTIKPGTRMPTLYLSGAELTAVRSYLETLK